jgi:hypothetical protein
LFTLDFANQAGMLARLEALFSKYKVSAYFFGHNHKSAVRKSPANTFYVLTGTAGKHADPTGCEGPTDWTAGVYYGFVNVKVRSSGFTIDWVKADGGIQHSVKGGPRN